MDAAGRAAARVRFGAPVLRYGVLLAAVLLLVGCSGTTTGGDGGDGVHGVDNGSATGGLHGADGVGADGGDGADGDNEAVTGSGRLISRQLGLSGVTSLLAGSGFVVRVTVGEPAEATIRMDDNLADLVDATVSGDQLRLGLRPGASVRNATLAAEITVPGLDQLAAGGASQVTFASELAGDALELEASGASRITGPVRVERLVAAASGAGMLTLSGNATHLEVRGAGTGVLRLPDLAVRDLDVVLSGASCAAVTVSDTLAASVSGASALSYLGTPRITRQQTSGASSIAAGASRGGRCGP